MVRLRTEAGMRAKPNKRDPGALEASLQPEGFRFGIEGLRG
jgi:hypothetical protein